MEMRVSERVCSWQREGVQVVASGKTFLLSQKSRTQLFCPLTAHLPTKARSLSNEDARFGHAARVIR